MRYTGSPMPFGASTRATLRLAVIVLLVAVLAGTWELFALQSPGTPLYIGMLPGPIAGLREIGTTSGLALLSTGSLMAWVRPEPEPKLLVLLLHMGMTLALGAQCYAALHGMHGVQLSDLRRDALPLFACKYLGLGMFLVAFFELTRRLLWRGVASAGQTPRAAEEARQDPPT